MATKPVSPDSNQPTTRKTAGDMPGPDNENGGHSGGVVRTMGELRESVSPLVSANDRALGGMGRVNHYDPAEKTTEHKIYKRM